MVVSIRFKALERFEPTVHASEIPELGIIIVRTRGNPRSRWVYSNGRYNLLSVLADPISDSSSPWYDL
jgi:hypothetical protein